MSLYPGVTGYSWQAELLLRNCKQYLVNNMSFFPFLSTHSNLFVFTAILGSFGFVTGRGEKSFFGKELE
jgi:hypothetical protein